MAQNKIAFLKKDQNFAFAYLNEKGRVEGAAIILLTDDLNQGVLLWASTSNQKSHYIIGIATKNVKHIQLEGRIEVQPNKIYFEDYVLFYIPLEEPKDM